MEPTHLTFQPYLTANILLLWQVQVLIVTSLTSLRIEVPPKPTGLQLSASDYEHGFL
jgi:hypothetical protein